MWIKSLIINNKNIKNHLKISFNNNKILLCKKSAVLLIFVLILNSCHESSTRKHTPVDTPKFSLVNPFEGYFLEDEQCQKSTYEISITEGYVRTLKNLKSTIQKVNFNNFISRSSLSTSIIKNTFYDSIYVNECDVDQESSLCGKPNEFFEPGYTYTLANPKKYLRICKNNYLYNRVSYEGIALTSAYHLEKAYNFWRKLNPHYQISKLNLDVISTLKRVILNYSASSSSKKLNLSLLIIDNLFYLQQIESIFVCPQSKDYYEILNKAPLWESGFVLAHEFNHHIYFYYNSKFFSNLGLKFVFDKQRFLEITSSAQSSSTGEYTYRAEFWSAMAESFADLFGFYAEGQDPQDFSVLSCSGINRNVTISSLTDGTSKILNQDILDKIKQAYQKNLSNNNVSADTCKNVDYTNHYNIAGVISYGINFILDQMIKFIQNTSQKNITLTPLNTNLENLNEIKAFVITNAITKLPIIKSSLNFQRSNVNNSEFQALTPILELMGSILWDNLDSEIKDKLDIKDFEQQLCQTANKVFPILNPLPYATQDNQCNK